MSHLNLKHLQPGPRHPLSAHTAHYPLLCPRPCFYATEDKQNPKKLRREAADFPVFTTRVKQEVGGSSILGLERRTLCL